MHTCLFNYMQATTKPVLYLMVSADLDVRVFADHAVTRQELQAHAKKAHLSTSAHTFCVDWYPVACGRTSPISSFSRVDFPAPLGPTRATRVSKSIPNSRFL